MVDDRVSLRVPEDVLKAIDDYQKQTINGAYLRTRTDVIIYALQFFLDCEGKNKTGIELTPNMKSQLEQLVTLGDAIDVDEVVRSSVRDYVSKRIKEVKEQNQTLSTLVENKECSELVKEKYGAL